MKKIFTVLSMVLVLLFTSTALAAENNDFGPDKITLRSRVEKSVKANVAVAVLGVRVQSSSLATAQRQVNDSVDAVVNALLESGVDKSDIQTARFNVNSFNRDDKDQTALYVVSNNITVKIHNIANTGSILDAAFNAGANQMQGINFSYDNDADLKDELMKQAVISGRKQAGLVVSADGRTLGRLLDVNVYNVTTQVADEAMSMRAMAVNSKIGSQVFAGNVVLSAEIGLVFEIKP